MLTVRNDRSIMALAVGFALLTLAITASIWLAVLQQRAADRVEHTLVVENHLSTILSRLQDAETGQRGYLLTGLPSFLEPHENAIRRLPGEFSELERLVADNQGQRARLEQLQRVSAERQEYLQFAIARRQLGAGIDIGKLREGKQKMDQARTIIAAMKAEENMLLQRREAVVATQRLLTTIALAFSGLIVLLLGVLSLRQARARLQQAMISRDELAQANRQLREEASSRAAVEGQLRQAQKMESVGQLTGGIAHDFNNMLAVVVGSLDMARRRLANDTDVRALKNIDNAMEGAQRATQLTSRLLAFSRQQPLEPKPLDINRLVSGMSDLLHRTMGEQLRVETVLAGGLWTAFVDTNQLENAVLNLCVNARDAMPDGGRLTVETGNAHLDDTYASGHAEVVAGQYVVISVTDTGPGMSDDVIARAFEPFFTTKGVGKGTGLGLSQVYGFVKQSHGHVKIYSESGEGTTVKIYLPRHYGASAAVMDPVSKAITAIDLPMAGAGEVILVVEDEERVRQISIEALRDLGYAVLHAADGHLALEILAVESRIDLLFTDVVMPDMNGRKLVDRARIDRPTLKVLFTTGYTKNAIVHNGMLDPGVALLSKPFTLDQLAARVRAVLDGPAQP